MIKSITEEILGNSGVSPEFSVTYEFKNKNGEMEDKTSMFHFKSHVIDFVKLLEKKDIKYKIKTFKH